MQENFSNKLFLVLIIVTDTWWFTGEHNWIIFITQEFYLLNFTKGDQQILIRPMRKAKMPEIDVE
jgi:hypothetical protein